MDHYLLALQRLADHFGPKDETTPPITTAFSVCLAVAGAVQPALERAPALGFQETTVSQTLLPSKLELLGTRTDELTVSIIRRFRFSIVPFN